MTDAELLVEVIERLNEATGFVDQHFVSRGHGYRSSYKPLPDVKVADAAREVRDWLEARITRRRLGIEPTS